MASILTCIATSAAWCFCTATASLLGSCCGNDKPSTVPPSVTSGRKRSVLLLILAVAIALGFQYGVAPFVTDQLGGTIDNFVTDAWTDGCDKWPSQALQERCIGNNGVYRAMFAAVVFFLLAGIAVMCKPTANREAWPAKYALFVFLCLGMCFVPNEPLFSDIFMNVARVGGVLYILLQQMIILDLAYNWNDSWVEKSNKADAEEGEGAGKKWLYAILASCVILFAFTLAAIALLFVFFTGCATNEAFISITLIMCVVVTATQLSGEEASLLSSGVICAFATYLCYTAVSKNPNGECNPSLGEEDILGISLGIAITVISLGWTGWSYTAEDKITSKRDDDEGVAQKEEQAVDEEGGNRKVTGVVTGGTDYGSASDYVAASPTKSSEDSEEEEAAAQSTGTFSSSWKLNMVLAVIACFVAMALTGWGSIESGGNAANPNVGKVTMWMVIAAQWVIFALYEWTLVAPRLFPDREFS